MEIDGKKIPDPPRVGLAATGVSAVSIDGVDSFLSDSKRRIPFDDFKINLLSLPAAFFITLFFKASGFLDFLPWYFFSIPVHEFGHAIAAWLCSHFAIPIGAFIPMAAVTAWSAEPSSFVFMAVLGGICAAGYFSFREGKIFPVILSLVFLGALFYLSVLASERTRQIAMIYGGVGGEFILSTLLIVSFYYPMPEKIRWDFCRFFFLMVGMYVFCSAFHLWNGIDLGKRDIPFGTFLNGPADANGDMDRLHEVYGWSRNEIIWNSIRMGRACLSLIVAHYFFFLWSSKRRRRTV
jgi:hypothetical protein